MKKLSQMTDRMKEKYAELFIAAIDKGEASAWQKPWVSSNNGVPCNLYRKSKPYQGVNHFLLRLLCNIYGYETQYFLTFNEMTDENKKFSGLSLNAHAALDENGNAIFDKKGLPVMVRERSFPVFKFLPRFRDKDGNSLSLYDYEQLPEYEQEQCRRYFMLRIYYVWNIDQTDFKVQYPEEYEAMTTVEGHEYHQTVIDPVLERMIMQPGMWRCPIEFGGNSAFYSPSQDNIRLPLRKNFQSDEAFYGTAIHEMAHSTARELKRTQDGHFGDEDYAMEEFVAELTSACVCSMLGVGKLLDEQHMAYVDSWRKAIREKDDFIPKVIDHIQRATNYILRRYDEIYKSMELPKMLPAFAA